MLLVYILLLVEIGAVIVIRFMRALVDFSIYVMYRSYDDKTLGYIEFALYRIN
jgi:hypothetical protein